MIAEAGIPGKYTWTPLPKNEQGVARYVHEPLVGAATVITSQSKNPEVAIKWLDYVWASPQGYLYANYGLEGEHYNINPEKSSNSPWLKHFGGLPEYSDAIRNNEEGKSVQTVLADIGAFNHPLYADDDESFAARFSQDPFSYELTQLAAPIAVSPFPRYLGSPGTGSAPARPARGDQPDPGRVDLQVHFRAGDARPVRRLRRHHEAGRRR